MSDRVDTWQDFRDDRWHAAEIPTTRSSLTGEGDTEADALADLESKREKAEADGKRLAAASRGGWLPGTPARRRHLRLT